MNCKNFARITIAVLIAFVTDGCAAKKPIDQPGPHHYQHCHEVARDVKNETVTVICPLEK